MEINTTSCCQIFVPRSNVLIVSFAGHDRHFGGIPRFEFVHFLDVHFSHINRFFYLDVYLNSYHQGIEGISSSIDETVEYLKREIKGFSRVLFMGVSSGGYAALLFGTLLGVNRVLAFIPQTFRADNLTANVDEKYRDLLPLMESSLCGGASLCVASASAETDRVPKTRYIIYGDSSITEDAAHHISHCERISHLPRVIVHRRHGLKLRMMRDSGELLCILKRCLLM